MVQRQQLTAAAAQQTAVELRHLGLLTLDSSRFFDEVLTLGIGFDHPCYDFAYAALAANLGSEVVTADERLVHKVGARLPVRWLGAL